MNSQLNIICIWIFRNTQCGHQNYVIKKNITVIGIHHSCFVLVILLHRPINVQNSYSMQTQRQCMFCGPEFLWIYFWIFNCSIACWITIQCQSLGQNINCNHPGWRQMGLPWDMKISKNIADFIQVSEGERQWPANCETSSQFEESWNHVQTI